MHQGYVLHADERSFRRVAGLDGQYKRLVESDKGLVVAVGRLEPGEQTNWHAHPEEEAFFVISGTGVAYWRVDGRVEEAPLAPGSVFYKTSNVEHNMKCTGEEPLLGIACKL